MNQTDTKTLWISVGAALFSVFLLYSWMQEKNKEVTVKFGKRVTVVVAKTDINEMYPLDETVVEVKSVPEEYVGPQAVTDPAELRGYVALAPILAGEQILRTKISQPGALTGLSYQVSPGKRAITIPVDTMRGVAKLLKPGDRIDLSAMVVSGTGQNQKKEVRNLMQNVVILATGTAVQNQLPADYELDKTGAKYLIKALSKNTSYDSITIEASPAESQKLIYIMAENPGNLFMTLRHPSDTGSNGKLATSVEDVLGRSSTMAPPSAAPMPRSSASQSEFAGGGSESESQSRALAPSTLPPRSNVPRPSQNLPQKRFKSL